MPLKQAVGVHWLSSYLYTYKQSSKQIYSKKKKLNRNEHKHNQYSLNHKNCQ